MNTQPNSIEELFNITTRDRVDIRKIKDFTVKIDNYNREDISKKYGKSCRTQLSIYISPRDIQQRLLQFDQVIYGHIYLKTDDIFGRFVYLHTMKIHNNFILYQVNIVNYHDDTKEFDTLMRLLQSRSLLIKDDFTIKIGIDKCTDLDRGVGKDEIANFIKSYVIRLANSQDNTCTSLTLLHTDDRHDQTNLDNAFPEDWKGEIVTTRDRTDSRTKIISIKKRDPSQEGHLL